MVLRYMVYVIAHFVVFVQNYLLETNMEVIVEVVFLNLWLGSQAIAHGRHAKVNVVKNTSSNREKNTFTPLDTKNINIL
jgi:hypothetical protein